MKNEIGGFFELELTNNKEYHPKANRFNLGRTAFECVLLARNIEKVFLPYFTCDVMLEATKKIGLEYEFYHIDWKLEPIFDYSRLRNVDCFVYTNYFGLKDVFINKIAKYCRNLLVDNAQAFFSMPVKNIDTIYSPRKFFGVPDGGYLYSTISFEGKFAVDDSSKRFKHLLGRIEYGAERVYRDYVENEKNHSHSFHNRTQARNKHNQAVCIQHHAGN